MKSSSAHYQPVDSEVGVYDCEIHLKFRLIEETDVLSDREQLLETLLDAFSCGADEYLEHIEVKVSAQKLEDVDASPQMRRRLIRLRNCKDLT